jgi:dUTP pyrophosphatase
LDLCAALAEPVTLAPLERRAIPTGFEIAVPPGFEAQVRARSGLALRHGITMVNGVGTIDSDYRGEVRALVVNLGREPFVIEPLARIAQLVICPVERVSLRLVATLDDTARGSGGFGSTGL